MLHDHQCCHSAFTARETRQLAQQRHKLAFLRTTSLVVGYTLHFQPGKRFVRLDSDPGNTWTDPSLPPCYSSVHHVLDLLLVTLASDWRCALIHMVVGATSPEPDRETRDGWKPRSPGAPAPRRPGAQADGSFSILRDKRLEIWSILSFPWLHKVQYHTVPPVCLHSSEEWDRIPPISLSNPHPQRGAGCPHKLSFC